MELDKNTFLIYNRKYPHAKLAQYSTSEGRKVCTYEQRVWPDQFWYLEESTQHPGYYYLNNTYHQGYRLAKWGSKDKDVGAYDGQYYEDQLWRLKKEGDYYRIYNKHYPNDKLAKFGKGNDEWGTWAGPDYNDQLWRLVPRFEASAAETEVWFIDNRTGTEPVKKNIKVSKGIKLTHSKTVSTKFGYEYSLKASLSLPIKGISLGMESTQTFSFEISNSMTSSEESSWFKETNTTYTAPAGKTYRVLQTVLSFNSELKDDNCALYCSERIEERD